MSIGVVIFARVATQIIQDSHDKETITNTLGFTDGADITVLINDELTPFVASDFETTLKSYNSTIKNSGFISERYRTLMFHQYGI